MCPKNLSLSGQVISAPLAGVAGSAYRTISRRYGAALVYSEMISADGLVRKNHKTLSMMKIRPQEKPVCMQLFGHEPETIAAAVRIAAEYGADMIDLNFGCPAKKVIKNLGGAVLMKDLQLAERIIRAAALASSLPISVKFRSGWDRDSLAYIEFGKMAEAAGASLLVLHPRTKVSGFSGKSDWSCIAHLKQAINIEVAGSGDVATPQDARRMLEETGCDYVMVGRAAMGAFWNLRRMDTYLKHRYDPGEPPLEERVSVMLEFCRLMIEDYGERSACLQFRKHLAWFTRGWPHAAVLRPRMFTVEKYSDVVAVLDECRRKLDRAA